MHMPDISNVNNIRINPSVDENIGKQRAKRTMSVPEMREMLGLKKTESYWLVHRKFFKTEIIGGKMRVDLDSFEKWYAKQVKYKKVNGEKPGEELLKTSYSFMDAANLLGIYNADLYYIWRKEKLETITVDSVKRIPIDVFENWYENQIMYRKVLESFSLAELELDYISLCDGATLLGITKEKLSVITRASRFKDMFEIRVFYNKKWISKKSFQKFLNAQTVYKIVNSEKKEVQAGKKEVRTKDFIARAEAATLAGVTTSTVTKWLKLERFLYRGEGRSLRIYRNEFLKWLSEYKGA